MVRDASNSNCTEKHLNTISAGKKSIPFQITAFLEFHLPDSSYSFTHFFSAPGTILIQTINSTPTASLLLIPVLYSHRFIIGLCSPLSPSIHSLPGQPSNSLKYKPVPFTILSKMFQCLPTVLKVKCQNPNYDI